MSEWRALCEVAETNPESLSGATNRDYRFKYIDLSAVEHGQIEWNAIQETRFIDAPSRARRVVRPGDVLFGTVRPALQSHGGIDQHSKTDLIASTGFSVIRAIEGKADPRYLRHCVLSTTVLRQALNAAVGSNYPAVNDSDVQQFRIFAPALAEQSAIAHILDTLDSQIEKTQALIAKLEQVKEGLLHDLLTRGVDENGELRPSAEDAPELYKESALGLIPREWEIAPLVSKIRFPTGQVDPKREPYRSWTLVAPDHIEAGTGRLLSKVTANDQNAISGKYQFEPNDVIYSKIRPYLRKAVLADFAGLCSADMYPLRPGEETVPRYLLAVVLGSQFSQFAESVSMRSGFPKINRAEMAEFSTGWPPFAEQQAISKIICSLDGKSRTTERELQSLHDLKSGLMDDLLTGRVRVTPLLDREPAEAT